MVLIEITEWIVADEATEVVTEEKDHYDGEMTIDEPSFKRLWASVQSRYDQHMAAVRNGDQNAVNEYAEFQLYTLKFNTMNENNAQEL